MIAQSVLCKKKASMRETAILWSSGGVTWLQVMMLQTSLHKPSIKEKDLQTTTASAALWGVGLAILLFRIA